MIKAIKTKIKEEEMSAITIHTLRLAAQVDRELQRGYAEYLEACEHDHRNGHRAHYCEHGTDQWTDYDNICGGCEDGLTMGDAVTRMRYAIEVAKREMADAMAIFEALIVLRQHNLNDAIDYEVVRTAVKRYNHEAGRLPKAPALP